MSSYSLKIAEMDLTVSDYFTDNGDGTIDVRGDGLVDQNGNAISMPSSTGEVFEVFERSDSSSLAIPQSGSLYRNSDSATALITANASNNFVLPYAGYYLMIVHAQGGYISSFYSPVGDGSTSNSGSNSVMWASASGVITANAPNTAIGGCSVSRDSSASHSCQLHVTIVKIRDL